MNNHPAITRYSLLIILALLLAGCRSRPRPTATQAPTPTDTAEPAPALAAQNPTPAPSVLANGWFVYQDPDGDFSFAYPPDAILTAGKNPVSGFKNILIQFAIPDKPYQGMSIRIEPNPKRQAASALARQLYAISAQKEAAATFDDALKSVQFGGISGVQAQIPSTNTELTIILTYEAQVFYLAPVHELSLTQVEPETLELFYQVLNSLQFKTTP